MINTNFKRASCIEYLRIILVFSCCVTIAMFAFPSPSGAHGGIGSGDSSLIHACVANSGEAKIVAPDEECNRNWTAMHWSIKGPPGPIDPELLGRISSLEAQVEFLQSQVSVLTPPIISVSDISVAEGNPTVISHGSCQLGCVTNLNITITLTRPSSSTVSFDYTLLPGTAIQGTDYIHESGTGQINPDETSTHVVVGIHRDIYPEHDEVFYLEISNIDNAVVENFEQGEITTQGTVTIINDDTPRISIQDDIAGEGDSGSSQSDVKVMIDVPHLVEVTVDYQTFDGTAIAVDDYEAASGTLVFPPGETSKLFPVTIYGDDIPEGIHSFHIGLSNPINATIQDGEGEVFIYDDDALVSVGDVAMEEGNTGITPWTIFEFPVTLSEALEGEVSILYWVYIEAGDTASEQDFHAKFNQILTFPAGTTSQTIEVLVNGDNIPESDETFSVIIKDVRGAIIGDGVGQGTILDDD